jgi:hypothetical protein
VWSFFQGLGAMVRFHPANRGSNAALPLARNGLSKNAWEAATLQELNASWHFQANVNVS